METPHSRGAAYIAQRSSSAGRTAKEIAKRNSGDEPDDRPRKKRISANGKTKIARMRSPSELHASVQRKKPHKTKRSPSALDNTPIQKKKPPRENNVARDSNGSGDINNESNNQVKKPKRLSPSDISPSVKRTKNSKAKHEWLDAREEARKKERPNEGVKAAKKKRIDPRAKAGKMERVDAGAKSVRNERIDAGPKVARRERVDPIGNAARMERINALAKAKNAKSAEGKHGRPQTRANGSRPLTKLDLKPSFEVGDQVYAAWWASAQDKRENNDPEWYPGTITSVAYGRTPCSYGPIVYYSIEYDDGDELDRVADLYVFLRKEYAVLNRHDETKEWMGGVRNITDSDSHDEWARYVGWWAVTIDGRSRAFSLLSEALLAYDAFIIRCKGDMTRPGDLNLPQEWELTKRNKRHCV